MNDPELTGQAKEEWDKIAGLVAQDVEAQIELHREDRARVNSWRARNGLQPI